MLYEGLSNFSLLNLFLYRYRNLKNFRILCLNNNAQLTEEGSTHLWFLYLYQIFISKDIQQLLLCYYIWHNEERSIHPNHWFLKSSQFISPNQFILLQKIEKKVENHKYSKFPQDFHFSLLLVNLLRFYLLLLHRSIFASKVNHNQINFINFREFVFEFVIIDNRHY